MNNSIQPGDTVAVVLKGSPLFGRLLSIKGSKTVVSFGGQRRDQGLPLRELIAIDPEHLFDGSELPTPEQVQDSAPSARAVVEAWQLLETDQPGGMARLSLCELGELVLTPFNLAGLAALWAWLHGSQQLFRWRRDRLIQPLTLEERASQRRQRRSERQAQRKEQRQLALLRAQRALSDDERLELGQLWNERFSHWIQLLKDNPAALGSDLDLQQWSAPLSIGSDAADLRQWLSVRGLLDPDEPIGLRGSVWSRSFPIDLVEEANRLVALSNEQQPGDEQRIDLTHLATYSLDDAGTREIDDALSLERRDGVDWIWIHIADPSRLIGINSPLDQEARRRATSLYLAEGVMPMLPLELAAGPLSLRAGQRCAALSVAVRLDDDGAVAEQRIARSWIRPRYGLTYTDGDELIELAPPGDEALSDLSRLLLQRMRWRRSNGAVMFDRPEGRFRRSDGALTLQVIDPSPSRLMVSEAMLLMGAVVASFGQEHNLPLPYRSQPAAELPSSDELDRIPEGPARDAAIKRCLSRGIQGTRPMPHFSLGLAAYVQATSPIRRYADLVAHRQILAQLSAVPPMSEERLGELIDDLDDPLRQSIQISREDQRHWQQVWFAERQSTVWSAEFLRWLRPQDRLALVHVSDLAMDLVGCVAATDPAPGDTLDLRVGRADPVRGELQLQMG
ncbi:ribonuclease catalytic domain-containing protein [Synechococcus sp. PROS-U-1]|uniref:ribonuclease catalytic domain-containing protein n=1 Tax=Synechococcus sp. PROS-U-1 TaxID=1400866 RepID=UPI001645EF37|nr:ribonuclease catalytic domain-containing protein [Synechococcus sp. PROS-U-1]QNJ03182.1 exoribonuclease II [Synechococcus sp. PROS-U-1]